MRPRPPADTNPRPPGDTDSRTPTGASPRPPAGRRPRLIARLAGCRGDLAAGTVAFLLVAAAALTGGLLYLAGRPVHASSAPLFAHWLPHAGVGTPIALAVAAAVVWRGPALAATMPWRPLLKAAYATAAVWILALALVDGWQRGVADRLTTRFEYLSEVGHVGAILPFLGDFADGIVAGWTTHVAGHPPGALLIFVLLDRAGLGGGAWAGLLCILVAATTTVAVPVTLRAIGSAEAARAAVPFVVLIPGAIWMGVSADGLFAGVAATGLALLAVGSARRPLVAMAAGIVLALSLYLSYGLILLAPLALAIVAVGRRWRALPWVLIGAAVVAAAFTLAGFRWWEGYELVRVRYYAGLAADRPYAYWVWANLAALALSAGPAAAPILRRAVGAVPSLRTKAPAGTALTVAAAVAVLAADLSGLSKAETERIWLPFAVWLPAAAALLPAAHHRAWLAAQAATALLINHLLLTSW